VQASTPCAFVASSDVTIASRGQPRAVRGRWSSRRGALVQLIVLLCAPCVRASGQATEGLGVSLSRRGSAGSRFVNRRRGKLASKRRTGQHVYACFRLIRRDHDRPESVGARTVLVNRHGRRARVAVRRAASAAAGVIVPEKKMLYRPSVRTLASGLAQLADTRQEAVGFRVCADHALIPARSGGHVIQALATHRWRGPLRGNRPRDRRNAIACGSGRRRHGQRVSRRYRAHRVAGAVPSRGGVELLGTGAAARARARVGK
jgi:hypothetical protein